MPYSKEQVSAALKQARDEFAREASRTTHNPHLAANLSGALSFFFNDLRSDAPKSDQEYEQVLRDNYPQLRKDAALLKPFLKGLHVGLDHLTNPPAP